MKLTKTQKKPERLAAAAAAVRRYVEGAEFALQIAQDKKFGKRLFSGIDHSREAWRHARRGSGIADAARRLAADQAVHAELRKARKDLQRTYARVDAKRHGHRVIQSLAGLTSVAGLASLAVPQVRERVSALLAKAS